MSTPRPARQRARGRGASPLILYPGAGSGRDHPALVAIESAIAPRPCLRADFPYRRAGRKAPDRAPVLMADVTATVREAGGRAFLGGRSMGGRICSMVAAAAAGHEFAVGGGDSDGTPPIEVLGLVLVSYPLHPPGRPDRLRVEHLPSLTMPCLFVHGTRDPFASPDELREGTQVIPGDVEHVWIEGGRHDLRGADAEVAGSVAQWLAGRFSGC